MVTDQPGRDLVFISYSHQDKAWLGRLKVLLKPYAREGWLKLWADDYIKVGDQWKREIDTVLPRTKIAVFLISPDFLASDFIFEEEVPPLLSAAERSEVILCCIPISYVDTQVTPFHEHQWVRDPSRPLNQLPRPRRERALVEIVQRIAATAPSQDATGKPSTSTSGDRVSAREQLAAARVATATARELSHPLGHLYGVPLHRPHYVPRAAALERLKRAILGQDGRPVGITGQSHRLGLHGMGGIGKTELAIATARDEEVRYAFPDGIYWLTLGQRPDMLALLHQLRTVAVLDKPEDPEVFRTVESARRHMRSAFENRTTLLILDDVWNLDDATALDVLGPTSRLLLTSRDSHLVTALGAREDCLQAFDDDQALALLAKWAGKSEQALPPEAREIAHQTGCLPLALSLVGARVRDGGEWHDVLNALKDGALHFLDHPYGSVFKSLRLSVDALPPEEAARYQELAVFPEDTAIPESAICHLWRRTGNLAEREAARLLESFFRKSLLYLTGPDGHRLMSLHDLQHDYLRLTVESLPVLHRALLDSYLETLPSSTHPGSSRWASLPTTESYMWGHLTHHLVQADRTEQLVELTSDLSYLARRMFLHGAHAGETDLRAAEAALPGIRLTSILTRAIAQAGHLISGFDHLSDLEATLASRLKGEPALRSLAEDLESTLVTPHLRTSWPMPDWPEPALRRTLEGHRGSVYCCAVDPTGRWAVSGGADGELRVWDTTSGALRRTLKGHQGRVRCCAMDSEGRTVVSGGTDGVVLVWDPGTGDVLRTLKGHEGAVWCCALDPRGRWIVSGGDDQTLRLWDIRSGNQLRVMRGHQGSVLCCAFRGDGKAIISGGADRTLRLWNGQTGDLAWLTKAHKRSVQCCAVDPEGDWIVSGGEDDQLRMWKAETGELIRTFAGDFSSTWCCASDKHGRWIVSGGPDRALKLWDTETGTLRRSQWMYSAWVWCCAVDPNGKWVMSGGNDGALRMWDLGSEERLRGTRPATGWLWSCAADAFGKWVVGGADDGIIYVWNASSAHVHRTLKGHNGRVLCCAIDPLGEWVVTGGTDRKLKVWDVDTGELMQTLRRGWRGVHRHVEGILYPAKLPGTIWCCAVDPNRNWIASGGEDGTLRVWEAETGEERYAVGGSAGRILCCAVDRLGDWIAYGGSDGYVTIRSASTGELHQNLEATGDWLWGCAIDPRRRWLVAGGDDRKLRVWDLATGGLSRTLTGPGRILCCAAHPEGRWVACAGDGLGVQVWDTERWEPRALLRVDGAITNCTWSADGRLITAAGVRGLYRVEFLPGAELTQSAVEDSS